MVPVVRCTAAPPPTCHTIRHVNNFSRRAQGLPRLIRFAPWAVWQLEAHVVQLDLQILQIGLEMRLGSTRAAQLGACAKPAARAACSQASRQALRGVDRQRLPTQALPHRCSRGCIDSWEQNERRGLCGEPIQI